MATSDPKPVLVLEDEFLIALDLKEALLDIGVVEVMLAGSVTEALSLIAESRFAAALLDVNVAGVRSYGVAERLQQDGIPFAFLTGYSEDELPVAFAGVPIVRKPFSWDDVGRVAKRLGLGSAKA